MRNTSTFLVALGLGVAVSLSGCVTVVPIGGEAALTGETSFNAAENVEAIWESRAVPELTEKAVDLTKLLGEAAGDLKGPAKEYGHYSMGDKGELCYTVKGEGIVTEVNQEKRAGFMAVKVDGYDGPIAVKLQIGPVYKSAAVRDSLTFIKYEDYKNQVEWAKVSQSIHDVINKDVVGKQDVKALVGKRIAFVGCFAVEKADEALITPISLTVK